MKTTPTDWFAVAIALWREDGNFLLPWERYAKHFSDPPVLDGHEPGQAPLIREIAAEWDTEVCGLALSFAALKARETLNVN